MVNGPRRGEPSDPFSGGGGNAASAGFDAPLPGSQKHSGFDEYDHTSYLNPDGSVKPFDNTPPSRMDRLKSAGRTGLAVGKVVGKAALDYLDKMEVTMGEGGGGGGQPQQEGDEKVRYVEKESKRQPIGTGRHWRQYEDISGIGLDYDRSAYNFKDVAVKGYSGKGERPLWGSEDSYARGGIERGQRMKAKYQNGRGFKGGDMDRMGEDQIADVNERLAGWGQPQEQADPLATTFDMNGDTNNMGEVEQTALVEPVVQTQEAVQGQYDAAQRRKR